MYSEFVPSNQNLLNHMLENDLSQCIFGAVYTHYLYNSNVCVCVDYPMY